MKSKKQKLFFFLGIFVSVIVIYYLLLSYLPAHAIESYINFTAYIAGFFIDILSSTKVITEGNIIRNSSFVMQIGIGCEGTEPIILFIAGIAALPIQIKYKYKALIIGSMLLYVLNILRMILLFFIGSVFTEHFELFHSIIFPIIFILLALITWGFALKWINQRIINI